MKKSEVSNGNVKLFSARSAALAVALIISLLPILRMLFFSGSGENWTFKEEQRSEGSSSSCTDKLPRSTTLKSSTATITSDRVPKEVVEENVERESLGPFEIHDKPSVTVAIRLSGDLEKKNKKKEVSRVTPLLQKCLSNILSTQAPAPNPKDRQFASQTGPIHVVLAVDDEEQKQYILSSGFLKSVSLGSDSSVVEVITMPSPLDIGDDNEKDVSSMQMDNFLQTSTSKSKGGDLLLLLSITDFSESVEHDPEQWNFRWEDSPREILQERQFSSLCGSVAQVRSVISAFQRDTSFNRTVFGEEETGWCPENMFLKDVQGKVYKEECLAKRERSRLPNSTRLIAIAPLGTTLLPETEVSERSLPILARKTKDDPKDLLRRLRKKRIFQLPCSIRGGSYWVRTSALVAALSHMRQINYKTFKSYVSPGDNSIKSPIPSVAASLLTEYFSPSFFRSNLKGVIAEIAPAVKPFPIVFPQFHSTPENDKFWGKDFTEWTLLNNSGLPDIQRPVSTSHGGLGYYNLTSRDTRKRWAELGSDAGVYGFMWYHYWFNGAEAPHNHLTLHKITEKMASLDDGEPAMPFFLSWANEPWSRRWDGGSNETLISQEYGGEEDWTEHFNYLEPFFKHPRYQKIGGRPVFAIYRLGHCGDKCIPMAEHFHSLAKERLGVPGLHIMATVSNFWLKEDTKPLAQHPAIQSTFHFWTQMCGTRLFRCFFGHKSMKKKRQPASIIPHEWRFSNSILQHWGAAVGFF